MSAIAERISTAIDRALALDGEFLRPIELPVSPWAMWLLFCLVKHRTRQQGVAEVVTSRLGGDLNAISTAGYGGHPPIARSGIVPKLPSWEYRFHGRGCCLTNRITGECIDVDFYDGSAEWFDSYFIIEFLESLKHPTLVERRLIALHPRIKTVRLAFEELTEAELLIRREDFKVARLSEACWYLAPQIEELEARWATAQNGSAVGSALGDWFLVKDFVGDNSAVLEHIATCQERRRSQLIRWSADDSLRTDAFNAFVDLSGDDAKTAIENVLQEPVGLPLLAALEAVERRDNEDWSERVHHVLHRANPNGDIPEPRIFLTCVSYLLRRDPENRAVRDALPRMCSRELGEAAILAHELAPEYALDLYRKALRSTVPDDRSTAAAALAILDQPWSHAELLALLGNSQDQRSTSECRAALRQLANTELHARVDQWEQLNPHEPELGKYISIAEIQLQSQDRWLQLVMGSLFDRVRPLTKRALR